MPVLTVIDTLGIQDFIFATNRVKDAVGGSTLVCDVEDWVRELAGTEPGSEVLIVAGGNALVRFPDLDAAKRTVARLSRRAWDETAGMEFAVVHEPYEIGQLAAAMIRGQRRLQKVKLERQPAAPLLGLSVTETCRETRLPAAGIGRDGERSVPLSRGVLARRKRREWERWRQLLPPNRDAYQLDQQAAVRLEFPLDVDEMGRTRGDRSLLGLVHVDGNSIGRMIQNWLRKQAEKGTPDDELVRRFRVISTAIDNLGVEAFQAVAARVVNAIGRDEDGDFCLESVIGQSFKLSYDGKAGKLKLPLRPLLLGGDDLTFLCDGRIALDVAATALATYENAKIPDLDESIRACAGIAIGRTHTPIVRLAELGEELCRSAKKRVRDEKLTSCALDWHIAFDAPIESLDRLRERQYFQRLGQQTVKLTCRPYLLDASRQSATDAWRWLDGVLLGDADCGFRGPLWWERRSKLKEPAVRRSSERWQRGALRPVRAWRFLRP